MMAMNLEEILDYAKDKALTGAKTFKHIIGIENENAAIDEYLKELETESIASLFPYLAWDTSSNLFILDGGEIQKTDLKVERSLGFCFEFNPQTGADNSMESILQALYLQCPAGTSISFHNFASPNILPRLKKMASLRYADSTLNLKKGVDSKRNENIFQALVRRRIDYYLHGTSKSLFNEKMNFMVRDFRCVVSVVLPLKPTDDQDLQNAVIIKEQVQSTLQSSNFNSFEWSPQDLINFVADFLDHSRIMFTPTRVVKEYQTHTSVRKQIAAREINSAVTVDSIDFTNDLGGEETSLVQMSVTQFPSFFHLSMMSSLIGDQFQQALSFPCPFMITTTAVVQNYDSMRHRTNLKVAGAVRKAESWSAKIDPLISEELIEWRAAQKAIEDGGTLIKMSTSLTLITPKKNRSKAISEASAIFRSKGFKLAVDKYQQLIGFMSSMPMCVTPSFYDDVSKMHRFNTKYSQNAVSLSPLIGEWKGTPTPVMTFFGRRGQLMTIDLFDNKAGNYNFSIVGASGSGKSFLTQELLLSYRANQAKVWVIDVGRSYENICALLDGDFIEFSQESNICINPFTFIQDINEEMGLLKPLVALMMSPDTELDAWSLSAIEKAIKHVFDKTGTEMTITNLADHFSSSKDPRMKNMGDQLFSWTNKGAHGRYFDGKANVSFKNDFTVLELEELKGKKDLQAIVLMIMMHKITNEMYLLPRHVKKICMIDEAWDIMSGKNSAAADFIETGYRRARKYGGAFGTATQNYGDYFKSPAAEAAFQNSDWTFTLRQKDDSIEALVDRKLMGLKDNPYKKRYFGDLKKEDGMFSEVYIEYPEGEGGVRLIVDPYSAILYSSKAEHFSRISHYKEQGLDTTSAVNQTLRDFNIEIPEPIRFDHI